MTTSASFGRRLACGGVLVALLGIASPAAACARLPLSSVHGQIVSGRAERPIIDGWCPLNDSPEIYDGPEPHEHWTMTIDTPSGEERLTIDACVEVSGAMGGRWLQSGRFRLETPNGNLGGRISGGVGYGRNDSFAIDLKVVWGSAGYKGSVGARFVRGCFGPDAATITRGRLRATRPLDWSPCWKP